MIRILQKGDGPATADIGGSLGTWLQNLSELSYIVLSKFAKKFIFNFQVFLVFFAA